MASSAQSPQPDYTAIAAQFGGIPVSPSTSGGSDYTALAKQFGGTPLLTAPGQKPANQPDPHLPNDMPHSIVDATLKALPYIGAGAATLFGQPEAWIPAMALAGAGGAAGSAAEQSARTATGINPPSSFGDAAKTVGEQAVGQAAGEGVGRSIGWFAGKTIGKYLNPERLYQSALKPVGTNPTKASDLVSTGIGEGIPLNDAAQAVAQSRIDDLGNQVRQIIASNPQDIDPASYVPTVQRNLDILRQQWGRSGSQGAQFVNQIDKAERAFLLREGNPQPLIQRIPNQVTNGPAGPQVLSWKTVTVNPEDMDLNMLRARSQPIPGLDAQRIKQATYRSLKATAPGAYEAGSHPGLSTEIEQSLAGSMRKELENIYPEVAAPNARQGDLIALNDAIGRFVKREGNKQITPYFMFPAVGAAMGFGAAGAEGGALGAAGMLGAHITRQMLEDPAIKSALAITLDRVRNSASAQVAGKIMTPANVIRTGGLVGSELTPSPASGTNPYSANPYK